MRKEMLDIPIDWVSEDEIDRKLRFYVVSGKPHHITTVNPEFVMLSRTNEAFKTALQNSDLSLPDGTGIVLAQSYLENRPSRFRIIRSLQYVITGLRFIVAPGTFPYKRITGVDLSERIMRLAEAEVWRVYLLGAGPEIAKQAALVWQTRYPKLNIVGATDDNPQDPQTVLSIIKAKPDVLLVAYGAPKQELFLAEHGDQLKVPIMVGVGGTFDTIVGTKYNPPHWLKAMGLEWVAYLLTQPKRLHRIWRSTVSFSQLVVSQRPH